MTPNPPRRIAAALAVTALLLPSLATVVLSAPGVRVGEEVRRELAERSMAFDTALVSLELAALHAAEGRTAEVKELARGIVHIFKAQEVHREALAAALVFRRAAVRERATARLAREVAAFLDKARHAPEMRFVRG